MKSLERVNAVGTTRLAAIVAIAALCLSLFVAAGSPASALADEGSSLEAARAGELSAQASALATANPAAIEKTAVANAKTMVKKAKATTGSSRAKLKKVYTYIATDKKWKGTFSFESYLTFWMKAKGAEKATYYSSAAGPKTMAGLYKKYAIDAFKMKKASCYHYAALFAVAAKQALGDGAKVRVATGTAKMKDTEGNSYWNSHHAWVEVTIGKTTYVYDTQQGNYYSKLQGKKGAFGKYCGSKKASVKATYKNYKGAKYCTVTL